jgi:hypothetical protein
MQNNLARSEQPQLAEKPRRVRVSVKGPSEVPKQYVGPVAITPPNENGPKPVPAPTRSQSLIKGFFSSSAFGLIASVPVLRRLLDIGAGFVFLAFNRDTQRSQKMKIVLRKGTRLRASLSRRLARLALFGMRRGNFI